MTSRDDLLLAHPVIKTFVHAQGRYNLVRRLVYLGLAIVHLVDTAKYQYDSSRHAVCNSYDFAETNSPTTYIFIVFSMLYMFIELSELVSQRLDYVRDPLNYYQWTVIVVPFVNVFFNSSNFLTLVSMFLLWSNVLLSLR